MSGDSPQPDGSSTETDQHVDVLPDDLDPSLAAGAYRFPDNSRRRVPAVTSALVGLAVMLISRSVESPLVNDGLTIGGLGLAVFGLYGVLAGRRMHLDETQALVRAQQALGFPVGHASAQQVWRGLLSRPTWRVLAYSTEDPPRRRGLVLVDAVDGRVVEHLAEENTDDLTVDDTSVATGEGN
ncbi:MAG: hypothetical protein EBR65_01120 [Actinobacteria bacterium]|jgi:hypothetical protein|nr:hypothetical protein [Actinomycetota bacterium]